VQKTYDLLHKKKYNKTNFNPKSNKFRRVQASHLKSKTDGTANFNMQNYNFQLKLFIIDESKTSYFHQPATIHSQYIHNKRR
jgi:hypothetical protein